MERSNKHSPLRDDALQSKVEGMVRSGRSTHAEDFKDPEPPADDEPDVDRAPLTAWSVESRKACRVPR